MKFHPVKADRYKIANVLIVAACILLNVIPNFLVEWFDLPLFLDTAGTILAACIGGAMPGIVVAVITNVLCVYFNPVALYFTPLNILIALVSASFVTRELYRRKRNLVWFILIITFIGGVIGSGFQWLVIGGPQHLEIVRNARIMSRGSEAGYVLSSVFLNTVMNFFDKCITTGIAVLIIRLFPKGFLQKLRDSSWRQKPLTEKEKRFIKRSSDNGIHSVRFRISLMLAAVTVSVTVLAVWISSVQNARNIEEYYVQIATNATGFTAEIVDGDRIDEFLKLGYDAEGYKETEDRLYEVMKYFHGVQFLSVIKIMRDGGHYVFDLDSVDEPGYDPGTVMPFIPEYAEYMDRLFAGDEIPYRKTSTEYGKAITFYSPIKNSAGITTAYAVADVSMDDIESGNRDYLFRMILVFSSFFAMILGLGLWATGRYLVYPIGSMAMEAENFVKVIGNQDKLDDNVRHLRKLEISTDDEVQMLYRAMCEMGSGIAEQMREIRYYSEATSKMQNGLIITMADMVENRDSDTGAHIQKTAAYVRIILAGLKKKGYYAEKLTPRYMNEVEMSAPLHDVGKINIPDRILNKPGKLTDEEFAIMKTHTTHGKRIMEQAISTVSGENYLKEARNMAAYHHERWDGKGYPEGLHGQIIPLSARVMAVADVFDALSSPRVYKPAFPLEKALEIIEEGSGKAFDPKVVEVFMESLPEVKVVLKKYQEM